VHAVAIREVKPLAETEVVDILVKLARIEAVLGEVQVDVKETKLQATQTNGRVNAHDVALKSHGEHLDRLEKDREARVAAEARARWQVASWFVGPATGTVSGVVVYLLTR
jgi:hypothetical protein